MKNTLAVLFGLCVMAATAEPSAYVPPPHDFQRVPVIAPAAVSVTVAGQALRPAEFVQRRSLNGIGRYLVWSMRGGLCSDVDLASALWNGPTLMTVAGRTLPYRCGLVPAVPAGLQKGPAASKAGTADRSNSAAAGFGQPPLVRTLSGLATRRCFVNGRQVGEHKGDFTEYEVDVTDAVRPGANSIVRCGADDFGPAFGRREPATHAYGSQWSMSNIRGRYLQCDVALGAAGPHER